jgi:hypothetical protein
MWIFPPFVSAVEYPDALFLYRYSTSFFVEVSLYDYVMST